MTDTNNLLSWFIKRPVATTFISAALVIIGLNCFSLLPIAPLPQTDIPTIKVTADFPGASAETMASSVAVPLENAFSGISGINNMISSSTAGRTTVSLQFDLEQNVDAAAQEVQSAINNVSGKLPQDMPSLPKWKKVNPADMPVLVLILKSDYLPLTQLSDLAENTITKQLNQIPGIAEFNLIGQQRPAINIKIQPERLAALGITLEEVRSILQKNSLNQAKGVVYGSGSTIYLQVNDQLVQADEYADVVVSMYKGNPVYLKDIADISAGAENQYVRSWPEGKPGISIEINRQPGANIVKIADSVRAQIPTLRKLLPQTVELSVLNDRTRTIRSSLQEIQITFIITLVLIIGVMFYFLKNTSLTVIVAVTLISSIISALGIMYLLGFSLNNLTLLALVIAIGFVVDDAIVVIENIYHHIEQGERPFNAAINATKEISFTLLAITCTLIAAFIPLFFMSGVVGKLFFEFAATAAAAILMSAFFSLTLAPTMASCFIKKTPADRPTANNKILDYYRRLLKICLDNPQKVLAVFILCLLSSVVGFILIPKGFFPLQDIAYISGSTKAAEDISFADMAAKHKQLAQIIAREPSLLTYTHAIGDKNFNSLSNGKFWLVLKDRKQRDLSAEQLINKLRPQFAKIPGIKMSLRAAQDINLSISQSSAQYLYTLKSPNTTELYAAAAKLTNAMEQSTTFHDVQNDLQLGTRIHKLTIDRKIAARYGITAEDIDQLLYDAYGQRQIGEYQTAINQYKVILKLDDNFAGKIDSLNKLYLKSPLTQELIPIASVIKDRQEIAGPLVINRDNQFPSVNISFNLADNVSLGQALIEIEHLKQQLNIPETISGTPQGAAQEFAKVMSQEVKLIALTLIAIYIILGILYESFSSPVIIISTLPFALIGAVLFLSIWKMDFSVIALIGCILLFGLVLKNGILMVEAAQVLENKQQLSPYDAIFQAAINRFRPILMTSVAAIFSGIPLIIGQGTGAEFRQPLGVVIVGGLCVSQLLTIFTTPVIYLYIRKLKNKALA